MDKIFFNLLLNGFLSPIIFNLMPFLFNLFVFLTKKSSNNLNKKLISFNGLFQFSVENAYSVKYLIFCFKLSLIILSIVYKPSL